MSGGADVWSYAGKRVVIAGCHSGMGEATARELVRLGAEVHGVDIKRSPVALASFHEVDLRDTARIDAAVEAQPTVIALTLQVSHRGRAPPAGSLLT